ncbi:hypothetical protein [Runella zeae]|uniref:hypothetical protein n=1 Tax=Runella zeae TaxID=94255 RepID=UPI0004901AF7|nr:hypothetical protein [Runella zeae]
MITVQEAFQRFFLTQGDGMDFRCNQITFCTADRKRNTGGDLVTLHKARLMGMYHPKSEPKNGKKKHYRRRAWRDFYDEDSMKNYRIHIDLILSVNDLEIA